MCESEKYVCNLSQSDKEYAAAKLNENEEIREEKINEIRNWVTASDDLVARSDDFFILRFLRSCKFDLEKSKWRLRNYYQQRTSVPEWYENRNPFLPEMQELFNLGVFLPLKKTDDQGRMIVIIRTSAHDPSKHKFSDLIKACLMILDLAIRENEQVTLYGIVALLDMKEVTLGHALQLPPNVIKKLVNIWQGCYPLKIKSMEFFNAPIYVNVVLRIFKSFMKAKLKRRVCVHSNDLRSYFSKLPSDVAPVDYGGTSDNLQKLREYWKKLAEDNQAWFVDDEKYRVVSPSKD